MAIGFFAFVERGKREVGGINRGERRLDTEGVAEREREGRKREEKKRERSEGEIKRV
jgi:hypothetical protein